ncbi:putative ribonuclease H protein [Vitis vinifera]|uniref:Putative ribonuclease H protein n=1 Tax=Vitis vinifera TaxID=29760 RepID=A0A438KQK5_VITVI|nr:putative ribonuclease H protein [Vitis vinifera]
MENERSLTVEETELKKESKENYKKWVLLEETHWRQLSREIWLREGDRNTGFFHRMASAHHRNNSLDRIKINEEWLSEEQEVREGIANAFYQLLSEDTGWKADIGRLQLDQIKEILEMFKEFHEHSSFLKSLNNTFLVLIPKKSEAEDLGDFRPISLLGGLYKLLAKVLANRLKKVVGKVVSTTQNAFVIGRQILDASLIANEVLQKMGFGSQWLGWMWSCLSSTKFSILVNGVPAGFFPSTMGLRQGDPLSPYLFVMGMEVLDVLIRRAVEGDFYQVINLAKSEIIPVGEVEEIEELVVELGCRVGSLPSQYLGLPLGAPNRAPYIMPKIVARRLEKVQRDFLWGGGNLEGKIHLVNWKVICTDKDKGGLGLRKLAMLNKALLGKWIWRYACDKDNLWKQVITMKYGQEGLGWRPKKANGAGTKIRFWTDVWCTDTVLSHCFPHLFVMGVQRSSTVEEMWDQNSGQGGWNLNFLRDFNDWELDMVGDLLHVLRGHRPSLEED